MTALSSLVIALAAFGLAPPPPPPPYDPTPGPYFIPVDEAGRLDPRGEEMFARILDGWQGDALGAFKLCFRPKTAKVDWMIALAALDHVMERLKANGANIVVIEAHRVCDHPKPPSPADRAYVEVEGVMSRN